jgi:hypothetical protein
VIFCSETGTTEESDGVKIMVEMYGRKGINRPIALAGTPSESKRCGDLPHSDYRRPENSVSGDQKVGLCRDGLIGFFLSAGEYLETTGYWVDPNRCLCDRSLVDSQHIGHRMWHQFQRLIRADVTLKERADAEMGAIIAPPVPGSYSWNGEPQ